MMRKYKLMKCLDDSCDGAAEKGDADESQVRRDQAVVRPDGSLPPCSASKSIRRYRKYPGEAPGGRRSELAVCGTFRRTKRLFPADIVASSGVESVAESREAE